MTHRTVSLAISPCPNDTFVFHALAHGLVTGAPEVTVTYADVDVTNTAAGQHGYDLVKVSYAALPWLLDSYSLLPCGGALGRGCGPLVLTAGESDPEKAMRGTVAIPGDRTTAYLLFRMWSAKFPPDRVVTMPFQEIMPAVRDGAVAAGLVIHEARFTYQSYGLRSVADLGEWWEGETGLPIPLGAILARRENGLDQAADWIRSSVRYAFAHPGASVDYVRDHAQELERDVIFRHIQLYVNQFTEDLGDEGYAAVEALFGRAGDAGLIPRVAPHLLRN
ncbi:MAG TPA: 1,4-dihydroxy-6-naphthoate synthase [Micromonosporaceae bacterium]|jgi:1,4-dihydroxy-6-naphthoate synthase|nr:1,4-dihydroxy-6-naphthoate synthase [Micromonosporaceae bacterium]